MIIYYILIVNEVNKNSSMSILQTSDYNMKIQKHFLYYKLITKYIHGYALFHNRLDSSDLEH